MVSVGLSRSRALSKSSKQHWSSPWMGLIASFGDWKTQLVASGVDVSIRVDMELDTDFVQTLAEQLNVEKKPKKQG
eukprot:12897894-Prorocentrum_lima.AAC.1